MGPGNPVQEGQGVATQNPLVKKGAKGQKEAGTSQINGAARVLAGRKKVLLPFQPHCPNQYHHLRSLGQENSTLPLPSHSGI